MTVAAFDPLRALKALQERDVRFVVIGGFACRVWGSPTVTNDLDVCYERTRSNHERLVVVLRELNARLRGADLDLPFQLDERTFANGDSFTFLTDAGNLDCLGTPPGTRGYGDLAERATQMDLGDDLKVRFASLEDLMRMKRAAGRPKDLIELEVLKALAEESAKS
jgi:hypothetical protein